MALKSKEKKSLRKIKSDRRNRLGEQSQGPKCSSFPNLMVRFEYEIYKLKGAFLYIHSYTEVYK